MHTIKTMTIDQARQLLGREIFYWYASGNFAGKGIPEAVNRTCGDWVRFEFTCGSRGDYTGWTLNGCDYITIAGDLPWAETSPSLAQQRAAYAEQAVIDAQVLLADAKLALASEGLPDGWQWSDGGLLASSPSGSTINAAGCDRRDSEQVLIMGGQYSLYAFDALAAVVDRVRKRRAEQS